MSASKTTVINTRITPTFGPLIFESTACSPESGRRMASGAVVLLPLGLLLILTHPNGSGALFPFGIFLVVAGAALAGVAARIFIKGPTTHRFFEHGVTETARGKTIALAYDAVWRMRFASSMASGLAKFQLYLSPREGDGEQTIAWSGTISARDVKNVGGPTIAAVTRIQEFISQKIAGQAIAEAAKGRAMAITDSLEFTPNGFRILSTGELIGFNHLDQAPPRDASKVRSIVLKVGGKTRFAVKPREPNYWPLRLVMENVPRLAAGRFPSGD